MKHARLTDLPLEPRTLAGAPSRPQPSQPERPGPPRAVPEVAHRDAVADGDPLRSSASVRDVEGDRPEDRDVLHRERLVARRLACVRPDEVRPALQGGDRGDRAGLPDIAQLRGRRAALRTVPPAGQPVVSASRRSVCPERRRPGAVAGPRGHARMVEARAATSDACGQRCGAAPARAACFGSRSMRTAITSGAEPRRSDSSLQTWIERTLDVAAGTTLDLPVSRGGRAP